ncbi:MAG: UDP-N-acetylglucosamine 2-epimerase (hydrolyzing) [Gemmatimonadaceae bacterium]|nr:UDP-N-acetylglucosamine 2-epimerase (hydrolyzing) [Gemmatimonadaceae bacterium]
MSRKLLFVTGTRADFGKLEPLAQAAQTDGFQISFFITGMHMMKRYGETRFEVKRFPQAEHFEFVNQREGDAQDFVLSKTILGFSDFLHEHRPDLVVIHGDRVEALAASIVCAMRYIPSAHIEGGEVSGTIDESIRHCNTKLCTHHFVSSTAARQRLLAMGEPPAAIYCIGSPELDTHARPSGVTLDQVKERYAIPFDDYGIVIFHPVTSERQTMFAQTKALFERLVDCGRNFVVILPNNDPGTDDIFSVLATLPTERFRQIPSMRFNYFSELLRHASAIVGNSSSGVREAPFLGIPSLDVGTRQSNRAQSTSVRTCTAFDTAVIGEFLQQNWGQKGARDTAFGSGSAAVEFLHVLRNEDFWERPLQKAFYDA